MNFKAIILLSFILSLVQSRVYTQNQYDTLRTYFNPKARTRVAKFLNGMAKKAIELVPKDQYIAHLNKKQRKPKQKGIDVKAIIENMTSRFSLAFNPNLKKTDLANTEIGNYHESLVKLHDECKENSKSEGILKNIYTEFFNGLQTDLDGCKIPYYDVTHLKYNGHNKRKQMRNIQFKQKRAKEGNYKKGNASYKYQPISRPAIVIEENKNTIDEEKILPVEVFDDEEAVHGNNLKVQIDENEEPYHRDENGELYMVLPKTEAFYMEEEPIVRSSISEHHIDGNDFGAYDNQSTNSDLVPMLHGVEETRKNTIAGTSVQTDKPAAPKRRRVIVIEVIECAQCSKDEDISKFFGISQ